MKKLLAMILATTMVMSFTACGGQKEEPTKAPDENAEENSEETPADNVDFSDFKIAMVTDSGGVNDKSFNESGWTGLERFAKDTNAQIKYIESKQEDDYKQNLDKFSDEDNDLIWGIGYQMADAVKNAAKMNPDKLFGIIDYSYGEETPDNVAGVVFKAQESSFLCGYIAANMTKTDIVGFIGGVKGAIIDQFDFGFTAGVNYAAKELGKDIKVLNQYASSFSDAGKGKAIAKNMVAENADIIHHAAGGVGVGVIQQCAESGIKAIGVDRDQEMVAEGTVITSAMKNVGNAMYKLSEKVANGEKLGGTTQVFGINDDATGIAPSSSKYVPEDILNKTLELEKLVKDGTIVPPFNQETYDTFMSELA